MEKHYAKIVRQMGFNYAIMLVGMMVATFLPFILTRSLTKNDYGVFSLFYPATKLVILILDLALTQYITAQLSHRSGKDRMSRFLSVAVLNIALCIIFIGIALIPPIRSFLLDANKLSPYTGIYNLCVIIICLGVFIRLFYAFAFAKKTINTANTIDFLWNNLWIFIIAAFSIGLGAFSLRTLFLTITGSILLSAIITYLIFFKDIRAYPLSSLIKRSHMREGILFSLPLIPMVISGYIIAVGDRFIINFFENAESVAIYSLPYSILGIISTLGSIATAVIFPYFIEQKMKGGKSSVLQNASLKFGLLIVLPALVGIVAMREAAITLIAGSTYKSSAALIPYLALYPLFAFLSTVAYLHALSNRKNRWIGIIYLIGAVLNITLNIILIPVLSLKGAAIATVIAYVFITIALIIATKGIHLIHSYLKTERIVLASLIMGAIVWIIHPNSFIFKIATIIIGAVVYGGLLILLKVFSKEEVRLAKQLIPKRNKT
jgi:O-antigen/teichoic acid export membrane protein